jgi:hypothetical protein
VNNPHDGCNTNSAGNQFSQHLSLWQPSATNQLILQTTGVVARTLVRGGAGESSGRNWKAPYTCYVVK